MAKGGKAAPWKGVARGVLAALALYLCGTALLALLMVKGAVRRPAGGSGPAAFAGGDGGLGVLCRRAAGGGRRLLAGHHLDGPRGGPAAGRSGGRPAGGSSGREPAGPQQEREARKSCIEIQIRPMRCGRLWTCGKKYIVKFHKF